MKKLLSTALMGLMGLALSSGHASAGWWGCGCSKCGVTLCARQYNAFSPFCLDTCNVCIPNACNGSGYGPACSVQGGNCLGELPTTTTEGTAKAQSMPVGQQLPAGAMPTYVGQVRPQTWQQWAPGMVNPNAGTYYAPPATMPIVR
jgi:hypothetical protein